MIVERNFVKIETQNGIYDNAILKNIRITKSLDNFFGSFNFSTDPDSIETTLNINVNDACKIYINDVPVMTGHISTKTKTIRRDARSLEFSGVEKTADIEMSTLKNATYNTPISLLNIIKKTCEDCGFKVVNQNYKQRLGDNTIKIINNVSINDLTGENIQRSFGENAFNFISKYANKRQVLLITNSDGNIVITRRGLLTAKTSINVLKTPGEHNSKQIVKTENIRNRFYSYTQKSQLDGSENGRSAIEGQIGEAFDNDIRKTKVYTRLSDTTQNIKSAGETAKWNANIKKARSLDYSHVVAGFHHEPEKKTLWDINQIVNISDDETLTYGDFLIKGISFTQSLPPEGSMTVINFTFKDSYE